MLALLAGVVALLALGVGGVLWVSGVVQPHCGADARNGRDGVRRPGTRHLGTRHLGPDATAAPSPTATARRPLTLVGLGDSVPSAETCGCTGYVEQVGDQLQRLTTHPWVVHNDATGGWTTADVEKDLKTSPTRDHIAQADLVVIEVGANDFNLDQVDNHGCLPAATSDCWTSTVAGLHDGLTRIIAGIRQLDHRPDLRIAVVGYWNVTVDGAVGRALGEDFVVGSDALTRLVNTTVHQVAAATGAVYIDAYTSLKGPTGRRDPTANLLDDGDHPNASGHTLLRTAVIDGLEDAGALAAWRAC